MILVTASNRTVLAYHKQRINSNVKKNHLNIGCEEFMNRQIVSRKTSLTRHKFKLSALSSAVSTPAFQILKEKFSKSIDFESKYLTLAKLAKDLEPFPEDKKNVENRVMGCTSRVWVLVELNNKDTVDIKATSDSILTKGLCAIALKILHKFSPQDIIKFDAEILKDLELGPAILTRSRTNGLLNLIQSIKKKTRMLIKDVPIFPSLLVKADQLIPQGAFAKAQAQYLLPDMERVRALAEKLRANKIGVVAHFYMDPEVQGMLTAAAKIWPHIYISDSLVMSDKAVAMAEQGCRYIAVLGVDFMSENVRAILDSNRYTDIKVYRMSKEAIGCTLAEAAESIKYTQFLKSSTGFNPSLHVIYINTSLATKANANAIVPTITCTSSNVVQTILQAFSQIDGLTVWYGPDSYMGRNIVDMFQRLKDLPDEEIKKLHPAHDRESIISVLPRLRHFKEGVCVVHHLFGGDVCQIVKDRYGDAYLTAHFEVPGEMFSLAMDANKRDMGVVGSTSNILNFINKNVKKELKERTTDRLQFVLGTESGMITAIVKDVQKILREANNSDLEIEIVFPVSPQALTTREQSTSSGSVQLPDGLAVVPGPASGEGCSLEGGCANCPYMKMNTLSSLNYIISLISDSKQEQLLKAYEPKTYKEYASEYSVAEKGCEPILYMKAFQKTGTLPDELVQKIKSREVN